MSLIPYPYEPEEFVDVGIAGEHPITFLAWIDSRGYPENRPMVNIVSAVVKITYKLPSGQPITQEIDVVYKIRNSPYSLKMWEDEILKSYLEKKDRELETPA